LASREELLSPVLKEEVKFEDLIPIALEKEVGALKFKRIKELQF
jgi:hypothetical protein